MIRVLVTAIGVLSLLALPVPAGHPPLVVQYSAGGLGPQLRSPDLIIKRARFSQELGFWPGPHMNCTTEVRVWNAGEGASPPCKVILYWLADVAEAPAITKWAAGDVPALASGQEATVPCVTAAAGFPKAPLVILLDCPVAGKEFGQVTEWRKSPPGTTRPVAEVNNVLVCPLDPSLGFPQTVYHPGACCGGF
jgi:hypothetical protein